MGMLNLETKLRHRQERKLLCVAYHEAGHAVAAIVEKRPFRSVTIVPKDDTLGRCLHFRWLQSFRVESVADLRTEQRLRSDIITSLAGHIAEKQFSGRNNWVHSSHDRRAAADYAAYLVGSDEELAACLKWLWVRTENLVSLYQQQIAALASALLTEKTIQAKRAREIFYATQESKEGFD